MRSNSDFENFGIQKYVPISKIPEIFEKLEKIRNHIFSWCFYVIRKFLEKKEELQTKTRMVTENLVDIVSETHDELDE